MIDDFQWGFQAVAAVLVFFPILFGCLAIARGVRAARRGRRIAAVGRRVAALVVDNQAESHGEGRTRYRPVVTFRTTAGAEVRAVVDDAASHRSHLAQTSIDVLYDPQDPSQVVSASGSAHDMRATLIVGLLFIGFGIFAFFFTQSMLSVVADM